MRRKEDGEQEKRSSGKFENTTRNHPLSTRPSYLLLLLLPKQGRLGRDGATSLLGQTVKEGREREGRRKGGEAR
jgi:hypothetical protein